MTMRRLRRLAVLACVAATLALSGCARSRARIARSEILRLDAEWLQAAKDRDVDRAVSYWSDDAIVYPPGSPPVSGKKAIREFVVKSFQTPGFAISWKTDDVVVARSADMAYTTGPNRVAFTAPDGKPVVVEGKAVTVWRRQGDGWKCVIDIWNDAAPAP